MARKPRVVKATATLKKAPAEKKAPVKRTAAIKPAAKPPAKRFSWTKKRRFYRDLIKAQGKDKAASIVAKLAAEKMEEAAAGIRDFYEVAGAMEK